MYHCHTDLNLVWSIWMIQPLRNFNVLVLNVGKQWHYKLRQIIQRFYTQANKHYEITQITA